MARFNLVINPLCCQCKTGTINFPLSNFCTQQWIVHATLLNTQCLGCDLPQTLATGLGHSHTANHLPLMGQQILGDGPALIDFTYNLIFFNTNIIEEGFAEWRAARDQLNWFRRNPRRFHIKQHQAYAHLLFGVRISAQQAEHPVGLVAIGSPHFLTIGNKVIAHIHAFGLQACQI